MIMKDNRLHLFLLPLLLCPVLTLSAQNVSYYAGMSKTLYDSRYYPALFGENVAPTFPTFDVRLGWADYSSSPFASICKHPEVGIGFQLDGLADVTPANGPGMGNIYSIYGFIDRPLITYRGFSFGYSGEFGLGFMFSKRYDPVTNPWNVVISSPVNAHISLGFQAEYAITPRYDAGIGFFFNHHSNGAITYPNYGLNAFELALRLGMRPERSEAELKRERVDDGFKRHFQYAVQVSTGIMCNEAEYWRAIEQDGVWVNDRYPKFSFQANAFYKYCRTHATGIGFDFYVTPFYKEIAESNERGETYDPFSYGFSILHEMSYYDFSLMVGCGRYIHHNDGLARNKILYQLVTIKYYFPQLGDFYTGIALKAHKFMAAESIQLCLGKRF